MSQRIFNADTLQHIDKSVTVSGWVQTIRDHSKVIFIDLRDRSGLLQVVIYKPELVNQIKSAGIAREFVLQITGTIAKRPDKLINTDLVTGTIELQCEKIEILNTSQTPPFEIDDDITTDEEIRMQYRYLDLRRPTMQARLKLRQKTIKYMRDWMTEKEFTEVETPMLTKDTPEGAREYLVPSRLQTGAGYALPQSPQQFKQLLMVAGIERYFQIAHLMRDEDPRGDRQPEFTQYDMEMSFIEQEDILQLLEALFTDMSKAILPDAKLTFTPFKRFTYDEVMIKHQTDKPDLRRDKNNPLELAFALITDFPLFELTKDNQISAVHHPFTSWKPTQENDDIMERVGKDEAVSAKELLSIRANCYDVVLNGYELGSGSIRIHTHDKQKAIFKALQISAESIKSRFGHILQAFSFGCPPHGGFAFGIDRLIMLYAGAPNIREVIAFPKTGDGRDLMMGAPSPLSDDKLRELHLAKLEK